MNSGMGGTGGFGQNSGQGGFGGQQGQQNFLGRTGGNQNQQGFLGRNVQGQQGANGQFGNQNQNNNRRTAGNRNNNQMNGFNQQNSQFNLGQNNQNQTRQLPGIRPLQKVGFAYSKPQRVAVTANLKERLIKRPNLEGVNVTFEESGELVLTGHAKSIDEAKLVANMIALEPGVKTIRNELTYPE